MICEFEGKAWNLLSFGTLGADSPFIVLLAADDAADTVTDKLAETGAPPLWLAAPVNVNWDEDFTPWRADVGGGREFSGGADAFGRSVCAMCSHARGELSRGKYFIVGYSLGGLAALYLHSKLCEKTEETVKFDGCGSCSGSLWYPGWEEYLKLHPPGGRIYLSLGGKEKNTRDALMATVADATEKTRQIAAKSADEVVLRLEPGGHFRDPDGRLARAVAWLCR